MNSVNLVGRLTKAAELRYSGQGVAVASFTIAVNRMKKDEADFINCVCFKKTAENLANYTDKGSQIAVSGSIQTRNYENSEGKRVYVTEVIGNQITFLDSKKGNGSQQQNNTNTQAPSASDDPFNEGVDISSDDLPF